MIKKVSVIILFPIVIQVLIICLLSYGWLSILRTSNKSIVIFYENDAHCALDGYANFAGLRDEVIKADTSYVLTVSSGDFLQGNFYSTISKGKYPIEMMNAVGYDVVEIGNHEFDYKIKGMKKLLGQLHSDIVCSNLYECKTGKTLYKPFVIKQCGNKKIAFIGILTPSTIQSEYYAFLDSDGKMSYSVYSQYSYSIIESLVSEARHKGVDFVIILSHLGESNTDFNSIDFIRNTIGIDAVIDGHSHSVIPQSFYTNRIGKSVLLTQTGTQLANAGKMYIAPSGKISSHLIPIAASIPRSKYVQNKFDSIEAITTSQCRKIVGINKNHLSINDSIGKRIVRTQQCPIGMFIAEAYRSVGKAEIGLVNGGGIRADIPFGKVTYKDILNVSPFNNKLCLVTLTGKELQTMMKQSVSHLPEEYGEFLQVAGLRYQLEPKSGNKIKNIEVFHSATKTYVPLSLNKSYKVCTTNFVIETYFGKLPTNRYIEVNLMSDNQALIHYISNQSKQKY